MVTDIKNLVEVLNKEKIGLQILKMTEDMLGGLREWGLEARGISTIMEAIAWREMSCNKNIEPFKLKMKEKEHRTFFDAMLNGTVPLDFKASYLKMPDNLSAQGALLYVVSGDIEFSEKKKRLNTNYLPRFLDAADKAIKDGIDKDFYYLILNKESGNFGYATLRTLNSITVNHSNFLQAKWNDNINKPVARTTEEFVKWIVPSLESFKGYKSKG